MCSRKRSITVHVFEDQYLEDGSELADLLDFSKARGEEGQEYNLSWHPTYNAIGSMKGVLIRSFEQYREAYDFLRNKLQGEAILFFDLRFQTDDGRKFIIPTHEVSDELLAFIKCYAGLESREAGLTHFNPKNLGLFLAFAAAKNETWSGVACFASSQDIVDLKHLKECLGTDNRIQWWDPRRSLKGGSPLIERVDMVNAAAQRLLKQTAGPSLWPPETSEWFARPDGAIPHDAPDPARSPRVVEEIRNYLVQLLAGFNPPDSWFENPQWEILYETLKGLTGACSVFSGGDKNLRLPAVPLLLAAQMASKKNDIQWLSSFVWDGDGFFPIMEHKNKTDAREALQAMVVFLEHLAVGKNGPQVIRATWGPLEDMHKHLWIDFRIDPLSGTTGRSLLQTIFGSRWGNSRGQTVSAYETMMEKARRPPPNYSPKFSLCIYPEKSPEGQQFTRLDFSIAHA